MDELFEICDEAGAPAGLMPRRQVHATGAWHRAVHVWVFTGDGRVYVQQRGADKDINPGLWDVGVGEHLQPGESWTDAARRGLAEELGIRGAMIESIGTVRRVCLERADLGIRDRELQQAFRAVHDGPVAPAADELADLVLLDRARLRAWLAEAPSAFTPGFRRDVEDLGLLDGRG